MKNKKFLFILAAVFFLTGLALNGVSSPVAASALDNDGTIKVSGEATLTVVPDQGIIVLAVETIREDAESATAENAQSTNGVIAALKNLGLKDEQIKTGSYSVYTYVDRYPGRSEEPVRQYRAYNSLTITVDELDTMGQVIDTAINAGANQVQSVRFDLKDSTAVKLQALELATTQAKAKGEAIAKGAGIRITGIQSISEEGSSYSPFRATFQAETAMMDAAGDAYAPTPITPGEIEVYARVMVEYKFSQ